MPAQVHYYWWMVGWIIVKWSNRHTWLGQLITWSIHINFSHAVEKLGHYSCFPDNLYYRSVRWYERPKNDVDIFDILNFRFCTKNKHELINNLNLTSQTDWFGWHWQIPNNNNSNRCNKWWDRDACVFNTFPHSHVIVFDLLCCKQYEPRTSEQYWFVYSALSLSRSIQYYYLSPFKRTSTIQFRWFYFCSCSCYQWSTVHAFGVHVYFGRLINT